MTHWLVKGKEGRGHKKEYLFTSDRMDRQYGLKRVFQPDQQDWRPFP